MASTCTDRELNRIAEVDAHRLSRGRRRRTLRRRWADPDSHGAPIAGRDRLARCTAAMEDAACSAGPLGAPARAGQERTRQLRGRSAAYVGAASAEKAGRFRARDDGEIGPHGRLCRLHLPQRDVLAKFVSVDSVAERIA